MSANLTISIPLPEDDYTACVDRLYAIAKALGYTYPEHLDKYETTKQSGKKMAVAKMFTDIALGKLKVVNK